MVDILVAILVSLTVIGMAWWYFKTYGNVGVGGSQIIQKTIQDGRKSTKTSVALPRSLDQKEGLTFSYTCWIKIDDFAYRYGQQRVIFTKGPEDLSAMCPALLIDGNTNSLLLKMDTFGGMEVIPIPNIPAKKWMHFALAVDQDSVDIYINGTLYRHHTLTQLPKQNSSVVHTGVAGGFEGKLASLEYYAYFMTPERVQYAMKSTPQPDPSDVDGPMPPYFDISWWTGRS